MPAIRRSRELGGPRNGTTTSIAGLSVAPATAARIYLGAARLAAVLADVRLLKFLFGDR
jgi:hypothetical protein